MLRSLAVLCCAVRRRFAAILPWLRLSLAESASATAVQSPLEEHQDPRHSLGRLGEKLAKDHLQSLGYRILHQGYRSKLGEIDIIAVDGRQVVFVEVKTWRKCSGEDPSAAVTPKKQDKITRTALAYMKRHRLLDCSARFDVVSVVCTGEQGSEAKVRHFRHAFEASGRGQMFR